MGQLMAKLMSIFGEREHKVIIVGLDNAGKTTILYQLRTNRRNASVTFLVQGPLSSVASGSGIRILLVPFQTGEGNGNLLQYSCLENPMDGRACLTNEVVHTCPTIGSNVEEIVLQKTHFLMWDIGGQESLRSTWNTYYSNTEFIILVIDSTDRDRLLTAREELYKMLAHEALRDASILIFANKQDMKDSMTIVELSQFLTLSAIKDHPWHIQGCCALTGEGLPAGLQWMQSQATAN